uniref:Uncharacterized protein n=1 Tax=Candidatus Kentrum sp. FW TaxID=2126338 RepID=A0A450U4C0_9GAMM|nr:MAG: hypothetical protein BECKFW1821C_GA0114237_11812 [Candidatus Kentron sp. FW]
MTDPEKADAMLRLMDMHFAKFRQSRDIEFKVNLAIWTVLVVLGKFLSDKNVQLEGLSWILYIAISLIIVFCHYWFWMKPIQASEDRDSAFVGDCLKEIQSVTKISIEYPILVQPWVYFEVCFSAVILAGVAIILSL